MYYKIAISNVSISYNQLLHMLNLYSKFYIIINSTYINKYYIIYLFLDKHTNLNKLKNILIYNYSYSNIISKIFKLYLTYNEQSTNKYIFIDSTLYNIHNIHIITKLSLPNYLNIFNLNKKIKNLIINFLTTKEYNIAIYHKNSLYINFIKNYIKIYKKYIIYIEESYLHILYDIINNALKSYKTNLYFLCYIRSPNYVNNIKTSIYKILNKFSKNSLYYNILFLIDKDRVSIQSKFIKYYTFNNLFY